MRIKPRLTEINQIAFTKQLCMYMYIYILTNFNYIYWLLILTILIKNVFRQFFTWVYSEPGRHGHLGWSFLHTGLNG